MHRRFQRRAIHAFTAAAVLALLLPGWKPATAAEFAVTPIRAEFKPGAMSETITVTNHANARLRVAVKLMAWTQDAQGKDVYSDSSDLIYFPRQMELAPESKRLVRIGVKGPAGAVERAYRLFIEEEPDPTPTGRSQVALYFRFGVPVFQAPAVPRPDLQLLDLVLRKGKLYVPVRNAGNQHVRLETIKVSDGAGHAQEVAGWYSLAGTERTYVVDIPEAVCRNASSLSLTAEGPGVRLERKIDVTAAGCA